MVSTSSSDSEGVHEALEGDVGCSPLSRKNLILFSEMQSTFATSREELQRKITIFSMDKLTAPAAKRMTAVAVREYKRPDGACAGGAKG